MYEPPEGDVALYIDWENIKYSLLNKENRLPNAMALKEAAAKYGRVVAAKAYANWQEGQHLRDPNDLYSAGIEPIYVPTTILGFTDLPDGAPRRKNSVDVKLAVDCVDASLSNPNIVTFVLVTGDGDFIHLINTLRLRGKRVVVIGTSWSTSWQLTSCADHFLAYDVPGRSRRPHAPEQERRRPVRRRGDEGPGGRGEVRAGEGPAQRLRADQAAPCQPPRQLRRAALRLRQVQGLREGGGAPRPGEDHHRRADRPGLPALGDG